MADGPMGFLMREMSVESYGEDQLQAFPHDGRVKALPAAIPAAIPAFEISLPYQKSPRCQVAWSAYPSSPGLDSGFERICDESPPSLIPQLLSSVIECCRASSEGNRSYQRRLDHLLESLQRFRIRTSSLDAQVT